MASTEILVALATETPHSSKVRCTLQHQTPEIFSKLMETINLIKDAGVKEAAAATAAATASSVAQPATTATTSTSLQINLAEGDTVEVVLKKAKHS
eukprot:1496786-Amphidinium_carterae.1